MDKIKIGKIFNHISTVIFVIWILVLFLYPLIKDMNLKTYIIIMGIIFVLFCASVVISNICLKDYKEDKFTEKTGRDE
jgi:predicted ABC-type exoprotein transport system permease subunit